MAQVGRKPDDRRGASARQSVIDNGIGHGEPASVCASSSPADPIAAPADCGDGTISVASLCAGIRLTKDVHDESGVLLLAAGMHVTPRFLFHLNQRNIKSVRLGQSRTETKEISDSPQTRLLDEILSDVLSSFVKPCPQAVRHRPILAADEFPGQVARGVEKHVAASGLVASVGETLQVNGQVSASDLCEVVDEFIALAALDADLLSMIVAARHSQGEYLFDHCVDVCLLSISIGAQMGMNREQLKEIGLGALLQDIGMLRVPGAIRLAKRPLTPREWVEIRRHPIHTVDLLEGVHSLPAPAKFVGYQVHERHDSTGYPRQRSSLFVHPYAKVVAIADAFGAMTRPRPYRPAINPYEAAKTILLDGGANRFDRTFVRAFLDAVSLYPIGSHVELTDSVCAKVIRANPGEHTRPVIEELDSDGEPTGRVIDLSTETGLKVARALPGGDKTPVKSPQP